MKAQLRQIGIDILIVMALYVLVEFARTESVRPDDWATWAWGIIMGALYRATPEIITFLGKLRSPSTG